jgi:hypothetical protein
MLLNNDSQSFRKAQFWRRAARSLLIGMSACQSDWQNYKNPPGVNRRDNHHVLPS